VNISTYMITNHRDSYTRALDCSLIIEDAHTLRLNHSLVFLKIKQFDTTLSDLESASTILKPAEKALFRKTQAFYYLQKYREYYEMLKVLRMEYPSNVAAKAEFTRALNRLTEQHNS
jgi:hypothetical protein